jgi:hypothetical protein
MNNEVIRLTAAIVAGSDRETAEEISQRFEGEEQEELRTAVQSFRSSIDVREWRKVMSSGVIRRLYLECSANVIPLDQRGDTSIEPSRFEGMGLGEKSVRSLERILDRMAVPEGAG